ncbi:hypothetical protein ABEB36_014385 [Hypothenemus hampei]|uniref:Uncharacterized protein n=1 Tax=Hypothenemus hampei TaxID=57062 RepID=A0ABD1E491_HYPHA
MDGPREGPANGGECLTPVSKAGVCSTEYGGSNSTFSPKDEEGRMLEGGEEEEVRRCFHKEASLTEKKDEVIGGSSQTENGRETGTTRRHYGFDMSSKQMDCPREGPADGGESLTPVSMAGVCSTEYEGSNSTFSPSNEERASEPGSRGSTTSPTSVGQDGEPSSTWTDNGGKEFSHEETDQRVEEAMHEFYSFYEDHGSETGEDSMYEPALSETQDLDLVAEEEETGGSCQTQNDNEAGEFCDEKSISNLVKSTKAAIVDPMCRI